MDAHKLAPAMIANLELCLLTTRAYTLNALRHVQHVKVKVQIVFLV